MLTLHVEKYIFKGENCGNWCDCAVFLISAKLAFKMANKMYVCRVYLFSLSCIVKQLWEKKVPYCNCWNRAMEACWMVGSLTMGQRYWLLLLPKSVILRDSCFIHRVPLFPTACELVARVPFVWRLYISSEWVWVDCSFLPMPSLLC